MRTIYVETCTACGCPVLVTDKPGAVVNRLAGKCPSGGCACHPVPAALAGAAPEPALIDIRSA